MSVVEEILALHKQEEPDTTGRLSSFGCLTSNRSAKAASTPSREHTCTHHSLAFFYKDVCDGGSQPISEMQLTAECVITSAAVL